MKEPDNRYFIHLKLKSSEVCFRTFRLPKIQSGNHPLCQWDKLPSHRIV